MSKLKPSTIKLLRQIKRKILDEPRQFQMGMFFSDYVEGRKVPRCGTAACIGGWGIALTLRKNPMRADTIAHSEFPPVFRQAMDALGISKPQANRLFLSDKWPKPFAKPSNVDFDATDTPKHNAKLAARRIEYFIRTGGI